MDDQENPETNNENSYNASSPASSSSRVTFQLRSGSDLKSEPSAHIVVDERFVKSVVNILEASSVNARLKKFDELLRALSTSGVRTEEEDVSPDCWQMFRRSKVEEETEQSGGVSETHRTALPYLNYSFYRFKGRSRLQGLNFIPHKIYNFGEQGSGFQTNSEPQDFYQLRKQCLAKRILFEDPEFPANASSLLYSSLSGRKFQWKRPKDIVSKPLFYDNTVSRFDVQQGELGDCWLLAAVANLTLYQELFSQIVPVDQSFRKDYAGIFHFRFWQYGRWVDVVVDDFLPTYHGELVFLHSKQNNVFWSALLEKAYAKLHGSYEALRGGSSCEAMEDLTGGLTEMYYLTSPPQNLFKILLKGYERWSLMSCSIDPDPDIVEAETPEGLIKGHAYSITKVQYIDVKAQKLSGRLAMLRLRNPWGNEAKWNGAWSDLSLEWQLLSFDQKQELGLTFDADGEFWMTFKDFLKYFDRLEICNLNPDSLTIDRIPSERNKKWVMSVFEGEWVRGVTAGGCRNYLDTFCHNPQYLVILNEPDEGDQDDLCTLIVALMQKNRRQMRRTVDEELLTVGFLIYHLKNPDKLPRPLNYKFFKLNASIARSPSFINLREIGCRFRLPKGTYCIVPSTFEPNQEGEFLLRVFSERPSNMEDYDQEILIGSPIQSTLTPAEIRENELIYKLFKSIAGKDEEVGWVELKEILDYYTKEETNGKGFSKDVCRSMIALLDTDRTGKLNFEQFKKLWTSVRVWKDVFRKFAKKGSGALTGFELRNAMKSAGYTLNNNVLNTLMHRYGNKRDEIEFDDFVMCAIKLKQMMELFKEVSTPGSDSAIFNLEDWIEHTLYT